MGNGKTVYVENVIVVEDLAASIKCAILPAEKHFFVIPVSQIRSDSEVHGEGDTGTLAIPEWLADDRDLEYS